MRATFQRSGAMQVRGCPDRGRCGRAQRAPREPPHRRKRQGGQARRGVPAARPAPRAPAPPRLAMVEQGDAAPLLRWAEGPAVSVPQDPALQAGGWVRGGSGGGRVAAEAPRRREPEEPAPPEVLLQPGRLELGDVEEDQVVAVFVVTFDPRSGESRLGMEGGGEADRKLGCGGGTRCASAGTHTPASRPARGSRGTGALCLQTGAEGSPGLCSAPFSVPPPLSIRSAAWSPLSCLLRFSAVGLVCSSGHIGFCFLCFPAGLKGSFRCLEEGAPLTPAYAASHGGSEPPCSALALARGCSLRCNFPSRLVHFLRRLYFEELT